MKRKKRKREREKRIKRETHSYHYYLLAYAKHLPCSLSRITVNNVLYFISILIFELWILNASSFNVLGWLRIQLSSNYQLLFSPNLVFDQSMRCKTHKCIIFELNSSLHWFLVYFGAAARQVLLTYESVVVLLILSSDVQTGTIFNFYLFKSLKYFYFELSKLGSHILLNLIKFQIQKLNRTVQFWLPL